MKAKVVRGDGFRGVLNYAFDAEEREHKRTITQINENGEKEKVVTFIKQPPKLPEIVGGNMDGANPRELATEFGVTRALRPDINNPVWHCSLSLPKGERLESGKWDEITRTYMEKMGFSPLHPYVVVRHNDNDYDHVHIVASRIGIDGKIFLGQWEAYNAIEATQQIEKEYGLTITKGFQEKATVKSLTKNEVEMALRTGDEPARQKLQRLLDEAISQKPTALQLAEQLEMAGVSVIANVSTTGRMNGFSFELDGIAFKASDFGKDYGWNGLKKRGVTYEQIPDGKELAERYGRSAKTDDLDRTAIARDNPDLPPARASGESGQNDGRPTFASFRSGDHVDGGIKNDQRDNPIEPITTPKPVGTDNVVFNWEAVAGRKFDSPIHGDAKNGIQDRIRNNARSHPRTEKSIATDSMDRGNLDSSLGGNTRDLESVRRPIDPPTSAIAEAKALATRTPTTEKIKAFDRQHDALNAPYYRITLTPRISHLPPRNYKNEGHKQRGKSERFWTADEVRDMIGDLQRENARGYDVYITPIDPKNHYFVVDDMTKDTIDELKRCGYKPCLIQESSQNNFQAIIKAPKVEQTQSEQSRANEIVIGINQRFGDPKFSGVVHPFRMGGFANKKYGRDNAFTRIVETVKQVCTKVMDHLMHAFKASREAERMLEMQRKEDLAQMALKRVISRSKGNDHTPRMLDEEIRKITSYFVKLGKTKDESLIDFIAVKNLIARGADPESVIQALAEISDRKYDALNYAKRTVEVVIREYGLPQPKGAEQDKPSRRSGDWER